LLDEGKDFVVDGVNRSARAGEAIFNTQAAGVASSKEPCYAFVFEMSSPVAAGKNLDVRFTRLMRDVNNVQIAPGEAVLMVTKPRAQWLVDKLQSYITYVLHVELNGQLDWKTMKEAIGGGPRLVKGGKPFVPFAYERFQPDMNKKHPRTAIGYTAANEVVLCVVDGRSSISGGVTFEELASIMVSLGCTDAINLDGGGSSTMYVSGAVLNRPSDGNLRPVANALLLFLPAAEEPTPKPTLIAKTDQLKPGDVTTLRVVNESGADVPSERVLWTSSGTAGWVDGGGTFRALAPGAARIRAVVGGAEATLDLTVTK
jgi:hypothetical protein